MLRNSPFFDVATPRADTTCSQKHSPVLLCVVKKIDMIMCHDKIFETLRRQNINKNREKTKRNSKGFPVLDRSGSMSWQNMLPNNTHQYSFILCRQLICYYVLIRVFETLVTHNIIKNKDKPKQIAKRFFVLVHSCSMIWHNVLPENTNIFHFSIYRNCTLKTSIVII